MSAQKRILAGAVFVLFFSFSIGMAQPASEELVRFIDITSPANPAWSPDHTRLAYSSIKNSNRAAANIFVQAAESGSVVQLTSGEDKSDTNPQWSPDGQSVLFLRTPLGPDHLPQRSWGAAQVWLCLISGNGGPGRVSAEARAPRN